jgi:hypothetical protein
MPTVSSLVKLKLWEVVPFVKILENTGENLRLFLREVDSSSSGLKELSTTSSCKEGRMAKYIFVGCKESLFSTDTQRDNGRCEIAERGRLLVGPREMWNHWWSYLRAGLAC